jgi:hypothetical protein
MGMMEKEKLEKLLTDILRAIDVNNGRCELIERVLCDCSSLVCDELRNPPEGIGFHKKMVNATNLDLVRIEIVGGAGAVTESGSRWLDYRDHWKATVGC